MRVWQVALSVESSPRSLAWYRDGFGLLPTTGEDWVPGEVTARVQGLPGPVRKTRRNLLDRQHVFQFEIFEYIEPRPPNRHRGPADIGYVEIGIHVLDFGAALARLAALGTKPLTAPVGAAGARRACVRDPDGNLVELMEDDPRGDDRKERPWTAAQSATRFLRASVPDLDRAERYFADTLGLARDGRRLHGPEHEALWGLGGSRARTSTVTDGDFWIELVQYAAPLGLPWPDDHVLSDVGILNVAIGSTSREDYDRVVSRVRAAGVRESGQEYLEPELGVLYVDDQRFSVEILAIPETNFEGMGFLPRDGAGAAR